jgi:D-alanyl-D-alanine carboxypeptidase/D-alanyl-D-alanine-endopeptidase (penicillin-binding protein 4)
MQAEENRTEASKGENMRKAVLATALFLVVVLSLTTASAENSLSYQKLADRIDAFLGHAESGKCTIAAKVVSLKTGEVVYERNGRRLMIPASNTKLFTTTAALHYLKPDFTVKTSFCFDGDLDEQGVLHGDLIIYGRGDPNISGRFTDRPAEIFERVAETLQSLGLREVNGDIIGDDSYFDARYYGPWPANDANKWYAARVSALSFNDNCIDICVTPADSPGEKPKIAQSPPTSYANVVNKAYTTSKRNNSVWAATGGDGSEVQVRGKIWTGKSEEILNFPVETPALYTATVFKETLERKGVQVCGRARELEDEIGSAVPAGTVPVVDWQSYPLSEMIKVINKRSQNLHAELLLKQVGLQAGRGASFEGGTRAVHEFARSIGIPLEQIELHDGSGLCRSNQVTVEAIVRLLQYMDNGIYKKVFRESLATVGEDESLQALSNLVPPGTVIGKTGSLSGVFAFSGYADGKSDRFAFSIIANNLPNGSYAMKQARDRICRELVNF